MGKALDEFEFKIRGKIKSVDKEKAADLLQDVLRDNIADIILYQIDIDNMSFRYPVSGSEK